MSQKELNIFCGSFAVHFMINFYYFTGIVCVCVNINVSISVNVNFKAVSVLVSVSVSVTVSVSVSVLTSMVKLSIPAPLLQYTNMLLSI